jgi:sn-glycerol 3-phosphate transport system substrate-binding protein
VSEPAPITIDVWLSSHPIPGFLDSVAAAVESFNRAHPEYEVRTKDFFFTDLPAEVVRAAEAGNPPEIADYYFSGTQLARDTRNRDGQPLFTSIQRAIGDRTKILGEPVVIDDIVPEIRDYYSDGDELVSMPAIASIAILFGNTSLMQRAGVEAMPRTWAELEAACAAVAALPDAPPHAVSWPNHGWMLQMELAAQSGLLAEPGNGRTGRATTITLHSPEILDYVRWWLHMRDAGHYLDTGEQRDWLGGMEAFARQELAFVAGSSATCLMFEGMAAEGGFGLTAGPLPRNPGRPYAGRSLGGQSLFLTGGLPPEKEDGALAFLQHLLNPRNAVNRQHAESVPVTVASDELATAEGWFEQHPAFRTAVDEIASSDRSPAAVGAMMGDLNGINDALTAAMEDVLNHGADPEARFRQATEEAQALLDRYNAACLADPPRTPDALQVG